MATSSLFPKRVFLIAGVYGILVLTPQYLLETGIGPKLPSPITQPELFYGFIGVALAWQLVFLFIAHDVARYRSLMPLGVLEKVAFGIPVLALYAAGRVSVGVLAAGSIDLTLGALFVAAYLRTPVDGGAIPRTTDFGVLMRTLAWLRFWVGTALAASGALAVVLKVSTMDVPGVVESVFGVLKAPGLRLMVALGCGSRGECFTLPWPLIFCLASGAFWATIIPVAAWALAGVRKK